MKPLITRSLLLHFTSSPLPHLRPSLLLIHTAAGDDPPRRRSESYPSSSSSSFHRRNHDEESRSVKVAIWWDFENCNIPVGVNVFRVAHRITSALRSSGIRGPVTINAFGDVAQLSRSTQEALISTGVCLTHVPHSGKNSSDKSFMADMIYWVYQNPPPAHFFLISGDKDFANILHRLRMSNYNILLASTDTASSVLCSAATIMWPWNGLVKGEDVHAKHFNYPPDGVYGSWYGYYKGALDDPFSNADQIAPSQPDECMDSISEVKPRPVPKVVVNAIRQVLHSYPEGINLTELRSELRRNNVSMDKDFFGHKKFSQFLSSMPSILKFIPNPSREGQALVVGARKRAAEVEPSSKPAKDSDVNDGPKYQTSAQHHKPPPPLPAPPDLAESPCQKETDVDTSVSSSTPPHSRDTVTETEQSARTVPQATTNNVFPPRKETDRDTVLDASVPKKEQIAETEEGFFKRIWKTLSGSGDVSSVEKNGTISEVESVKEEVSPKEAPTLRSSKHDESVKPEEKTAESRISSHFPGSGLSSLDGNKSSHNDKAGMQSEEFSNAPQQRMGFFRKMARWWISRKSGGEGQGESSISIKDAIDNEATSCNGECTEVMTHPSSEPEAHDLYSKPYFWHALKLFLQTEKGPDLISTSRTRDQLAQVFQTECTLLKNLKDSHLLHLVDLLISEKKWVEEQTSQAFPFKLSLPPQGNCIQSHAHASNGLSSLFTGRTPQPSLKSPPEQKKRAPNREEILSNCHKLVTELFEENPQGFNMSVFRPRFILKYGYVLDYEMLGYPKLVSLLQIMPGVRVESSFILPAAKFLGDFGQENHNSEEGEWAELGPVSNQEKDKGASFTEVSLSEDSDSGDDGSERKCNKGEEDSSLLQILDSWYSVKEGGDKDRAQAVDGLVDCSRSKSQKPPEQKLKVKPQKPYSFVVDSGDEGKERLVESILGSLKKAGDSRLQS